MTYVTFHVIDAITSTNVLLGRPWLHEHKVMPSTWHQCFKYKTPERESNRIFANTKPFTTTERNDKIHWFKSNTREEPHPSIRVKTMLPLSMLPVLTGTEAKVKHLNKRNERRAYSYSMLASQIRISEWCDDEPSQSWHDVEWSGKERTSRTFFIWYERTAAYYHRVRLVENSPS